MKRGTSGLSLVVGIHKPVGMSSHDVVNRCRRIFGERRVGHTGTLDPLASGALLVCVGPASRLDPFLTAHDKAESCLVSFGQSTQTDDAEGDVVRREVPPREVYDEAFARRFLASLVGHGMQVPPAYSAIKVQGVRAYDAARAGKELNLEPRSIEVYEARLLALIEEGEDGLPAWEVAVRVSKGTYVRSLARDIGAALGCPAYVTMLERTASGAFKLEDCVSLEALEAMGDRAPEAALDPVRLLGFRVLFADEHTTALVRNGGKLSARQQHLYSYSGSENALSTCTSGLRECNTPLQDGEYVTVVHGCKLMAIYVYDSSRGCLAPKCVFSTEVSRGEYL